MFSISFQSAGKIVDKKKNIYIHTYIHTYQQTKWKNRSFRALDARPCNFWQNCQSLNFNLNEYYNSWLWFRSKLKGLFSYIRNFCKIYFNILFGTPLMFHSIMLKEGMENLFSEKKGVDSIILIWSLST